MKFQCDRCKTRYSIADEKVRGKVLKIRCKNCETVITVREGMEAPVGVSGQTMAFPAITGIMPTPGALTPVASPAPAAPPTPAPAADEWFVSIDGNQEGPFTLAQARERVGKRRPGQEMHAWKDDFADWLPVDKVRELAPYLPKRAAPPPPPRPVQPIPTPAAHDAPPPAAPAPLAKPAFDFSVPAAPQSAPPPAAADDGLDFAISEPSRVARLHPPGKNGSAAKDSMSFPVAMLQSQASMSMSMPVPQRRPVILYLAGLVALIAVVVVVIVVMSSRGRDETPAATAGGESSEYIADVYKGGKVAPDRPVTPVEPTEPPGKTIEMPPQTPEPRRPSNVAKPKVTNGTSAPDPLGKEEALPTETPRTESLEPLSPDDVIAMYRANETGLKWCYERALKEDPNFRMNKVSVTVSIEKSGTVSKITLPDQAATLGTCLTSRIRAWRFRKSTEGLNMQFDILFARN